MAVEAVPLQATGDKGLKSNALGLVSSIVIGVASTAPGYSLAASLGLVVAAVGLGSPAVMWVAFIPMLLVATSYYYLNRVDPDCGTTFSWAAKAFGPVAGWIGGWAIVVADVVVMANLADIAGRYSFLLVGADHAANSKYWVLLIGVIWIVVMTWICYVGIEVSAKTQWFLLTAEVVTLAIFAIVAIAKVYTSHPTGSIRPSLSWLNPADISSTNALISGVLVAIFIYWGWDSLVSVNEETEDSKRTPGIAAVLSTIILVAIYVVVAIAAQAFHGTQFLIDNSDDVLSGLGKAVFGSPWDKLLIIAVLTSASASTQTTILPTSRTTLSMASHGAIPRTFARIHPRHLTPSVSTIWMGIVSIVWYVLPDDRQPEHPLRLDRRPRADDRVLLRAFRLRLCLVLPAELPHREGRAARRRDAAPRRGQPRLRAREVDHRPLQPGEFASGTSWFGIGPPLLITVALLGLGIVLMLLQWRVSPAFFRRKAELAPPEMTLEREDRARLRRSRRLAGRARRDRPHRGRDELRRCRRLRLLHQPARRRRRARLQGGARAPCGGRDVPRGRDAPGSRHRRLGAARL